MTGLKRVATGAGGATTVSFELAGPHLDRVRLGGLLLLRRVGVLVRDGRWMTVPGRLLRTDPGTATTSALPSPSLLPPSPSLSPPSSLSLVVRHGADFSWRGTATVTEDSLTFTFDGRAERDFERTRIGLCLIHPPHLAGTPVEVNGLAAGEFPRRISPHQIFTGIRTMSYRDGGALVTIELNGETFETEDHRNWSDAGYKTYGTPLGLGRPVPVRRGDHVHQRLHLTVTDHPLSQPRPRRRRIRGGATTRVQLRVPQPSPAGPLPYEEPHTQGEPPAGEAPPFSEPHTQREQPSGGTLPSVGLYLGRPPADGRKLAGPSFLHGTVDLDEPGWREVADRFSTAARAAGATLTLSAVCSSPDQVAALRDVPGLDTLLAFDRTHGTPRELAEAARRPFRGGPPSFHGPQVPFAGAPVRIGGGSRAHFAELNRAVSLPSDLLDLVCFPIAAQAHHDDEASARETLAVHPLLVGQAAEHGLPVLVGPVGLLPTFGFAAPRGAHDPASSALFRTTWLTAALITLANAGAAAISVDACDAAETSTNDRLAPTTAEGSANSHHTTATAIDTPTASAAAESYADDQATGADAMPSGLLHVLAVLRPFVGGRLVDPRLAAGLVGLAVHHGGRRLVLAAALDADGGGNGHSGCDGCGCGDDRHGDDEHGHGGGDGCGEPVFIDTRGHTVTTITGGGDAGGVVVQEHPPGTETTALTAPAVAILISPAGLTPARPASTKPARPAPPRDAPRGQAHQPGPASSPEPVPPSEGDH
ncbi:hypothetical protein ACQP2T_02840 [Nonomuraea sp. CA-143628]|uniref:hypothetical protein n=1 Tax=Nonomuraea sp. CA-143628 TaxID=3239997 RepID=UPI003D8CEB2B